MNDKYYGIVLNNWTQFNLIECNWFKQQNYFNKSSSIFTLFHRPKT
jgi:hypothetical protein